MKYQVINKQTKEIVGTYTNATRARNTRDRKDNQYGSYVHTVVIIAA